MSRKTLAAVLVVLSILLVIPSLSPLSPRLARGAKSLPQCMNTTTQSWSPAAGVVVTITASACVVGSGSQYGIHSITSSTNSPTIVARSATWDFFGEKYGCGYSCNSKDIYSYPGSSGAGVFPNLNQTIGPLNSLVCTITQFNLGVLYQPTGQTYTLSAKSMYPNPYCF